MSGPTTGARPRLAVACVVAVGAFVVAGLVAAAAASARHNAASPTRPVAAPAAVPARTGTVTGQRVTLPLGQNASPSQIDAGEPNEDLEREKAGPTDTPYTPTESQTPVGPARSGHGKAAKDPFTVFRSTSTNPKAGSAIQEPTAANDGNAILATANGPRAGLSTDDGLTWPSSLALNPLSTKLPAGYKACCDQVAYTVDRGSHALTFWLIQNDCAGTRCGNTAPNPTKENALTLRMFADQGDLLAGTSCDFILKPSMFGLNKDFFDFDKLSSTRKFLYLSTDVRTLTHNSAGAEIIRFPLDNLDDGDCGFAWRAYHLPNESSLAPVEHAGSKMFFAEHVNDAIQGDQLRIYSIEDGSNTLSQIDRNVNNYGPGSRGSGSCKSPDGDDPCARFTDNQTVGFHSGNSVGWLWTAPQDSKFPFPQVRVAVFRTSDLKRVTEHTIWYKKSAWTYPAVGVNNRGDVGVVLYQMGGGSYPSPHAFIRTDPRDWSGISTHRLAIGTASFKTNTWGDFASVHAYAGCGNTFLATAWSVSNSSAPIANDLAIWFGNNGDGCADLAVTAAGGLADQVPLRPGGSISVVHITKNLGVATAGASTTRYYLSKNVVKSSDDILLTGSQTDPALVPGGQTAITTALTAGVPATTAPGPYKLLGCANDVKPVAETTNANNCFAANETLTISP
jgi:hypothetical protein